RCWVTWGARSSGMYAWIWRHLPFGLPGKIIGSLVLAGSAVALLWYVVFPWIDPFVEETLLPWSDSQIESEVTPGGDHDPADEADPDDGGLVGPDGQPIDEHDIPYDTGE